MSEPSVRPVVGSSKGFIRYQFTSPAQKAWEDATKKICRIVRDRTGKKVSVCEAMKQLRPGEKDTIHDQERAAVGLGPADRTPKRPKQPRVSPQVHNIFSQAAPAPRAPVRKGRRVAGVAGIPTEDEVANLMYVAGLKWAKEA